jgi:hypothetical protein
LTNGYPKKKKKKKNKNKKKKNKKNKNKNKNNKVKSKPLELYELADKNICQKKLFHECQAIISKKYIFAVQELRVGKKPGQLSMVGKSSLIFQFNGPLTNARKDDHGEAEFFICFPINLQSGDRNTKQD